MAEATALGARVATVRARIDNAARLAGRSAHEVTLIAVTKTVGIDQILSAIDAGIQDLGENRVQELATKLTQLGNNQAATWHLIGHLQRNKVRRAVELAHVVHSVDSASLAQDISIHAVRAEKSLDAFIQVNVSAEESKFGFEPAALPAACEAMAKLGGLRWRGLMTIASEHETGDGLRRQFEMLRRLQQKLAAAFEPAYWNALSMGMTNDFELAIAEGATHVRVGRAIFGERSGIATVHTA